MPERETTYAANAAVTTVGTPAGCVYSQLRERRWKGDSTTIEHFGGVVRRATSITPVADESGRSSRCE